MLSLDPHRKRKNIQRQRSRLISPELASVPHNRSAAQMPFAENVVRTPPYCSPGIPFPPGVATGSYFERPAQPVYPLPFDGARISGKYEQYRRGTEPLFNPMSVDQINRYHSSLQQTERVPVIRGPIVIFGSGNKDASQLCPPPGRRIVVHGAVSFLFLFILVGTLMAVAPVEDNGYIGMPGSLQFLFNISSSRRAETALIAAANATATAITVDGYDPGNIHYAGMPEVFRHAHMSTVESGNLGRFFYGQCTYWANMRYHQLTGRWIPWLGDAYEWAYQAPAYNWMLSNTPNPHGYSIMVFSPDAEGSGTYGHVAVVERVNPDGSVLTSNWNWDGMWATQSWLTFYPGRGVSFIWYPN